jgi:hypothetical protein
LQVIVDRVRGLAALPLPGILFGGTGKIFRKQYWNLEYIRIEVALAEGLSSCRKDRPVKAPSLRIAATQAKGRQRVALFAALGDIVEGAA